MNSELPHDYNWARYNSVLVSRAEKAGLSKEEIIVKLVEAFDITTKRLANAREVKGE